MVHRKLITTTDCPQYPNGTKGKQYSRCKMLLKKKKNSRCKQESDITSTEQKKIFMIVSQALMIKTSSALEPSSVHGLHQSLEMRSFESEMRIPLPVVKLHNCIV